MIPLNDPNQVRMAATARKIALKKADIAARTYPAHALKAGDAIKGRVIFDVRANLGGGGRVAIIFDDMTEQLVASWDTKVTVDLR